MKLKIFTDGGARGNPGPAGIGVAVYDQKNKLIHTHSEFVGQQTNNVAEYMALIQALEWSHRFCSSTAVESMEFFLDSKLVVEQVKRNWKVKQDHLKPLAERAKVLFSTLFVPATISHVSREKNKHADLLVNEAVDSSSS